MPGRVVGVICALVAGWMLLTGMGGTDSSGPVSIPVPDKNYNVVLTDTDSVVTRLSGFSVNGMTFVTGRVGRGEVALSFNRIKSLDLRRQGDKIEATALLAGGGKLVMTMGTGVTLAGKVPYGNFRIKLSDVRRVEFR